jgi:hypothetical protein
MEGQRYRGCSSGYFAFNQRLLFGDDVDDGLLDQDGGEPSRRKSIYPNMIRPRSRSCSRRASRRRDIHWWSYSS